MIVLRRRIWRKLKLLAKVESKKPHPKHRPKVQNLLLRQIKLLKKKKKQLRESCQSLKITSIAPLCST